MFVCLSSVAVLLLFWGCCCFCLFRGGFFVVCFFIIFLSVFVLLYVVVCFAVVGWVFVLFVCLFFVCLKKIKMFYTLKKIKNNHQLIIIDISTDIRPF